MPNPHDKQRMSNAIRALTMDAVQAANSGHPGMPMGMADAATALFSDHLKFSASAPNWQTATGLCCPPDMGRCCFMHCCI